MAADGAFMEQPVRLLRPDEERTTLVPDEGGLALLDSIQGAVTVVAIVGTQRGGKSSLLNLLYGRRLKGFGIGHYMDPRTDGLWMWIREHPRQQGVKVMYLDTEGLDSPHVAAFYNWTLSALTLLISDVFIYQVRPVQGAPPSGRAHPSRPSAVHRQHRPGRH